MSSITVLGLVAGAFTTLSFLPQLLKVRRSQSASDLSWSMLWVVNAGLLLWLIYGLCLRDMVLILSNGVSLGLAALILVYKIRYECSTSERYRSYAGARRRWRRSMRERTYDRTYERRCDRTPEPLPQVAGMTGPKSI